MKALKLSLNIMLLTCLGLMSASTTFAQTQDSQGAPAMQQPSFPPSTGAVPGTPPPGMPTTLTMPPKSVSDRHVYYFFFSRVTDLDRLADKIDSEGKKNADYYRTLHQKGAGLTDAEGEILRQISDECIQLLDEQDAKRKAIIDARLAQSTTPPKNSLTMSEMGEFGYNRNLILDAQILKLRESLGEESFSKLDTYVHQLIHPSTVPTKINPGIIHPVQPPQQNNTSTPANSEGDGGPR